MLSVSQSFTPQLWINLKCLHVFTIEDNLRKGVINSPYHAFGKNDIIFANRAIVFSKLLEAVNSLIHEMNSNGAEVFNNIVAKCVGGKSINYY